MIVKQEFNLEKLPNFVQQPEYKYKINDSIFNDPKFLSSIDNSLTEIAVSDLTDESKLLKMFDFIRIKGKSSNKKSIKKKI